ncbi:hypothetical protein PVK06_049227 [Gossypium arboreum]|uniref:Uncharacterized protein n=1 Tax=Gossypium arboreum TaxID=29729 RepID=A0ABR0MK26_GOSAR|nr:hypothetical protein PVK06_049227 [Gossypium arboreum]
MDNCSNTLGEAILGQHDSTSKLSDETLRLIVKLLKALDDEVTQLTLKPTQECHFVQKLAIDVWKCVFLQAYDVDDLNDESLGDAIALLFKVAS